MTKVDFAGGRFPSPGEDDSKTRAPNKGQPLVSIGVPVYNEAKYLRATLDSLLVQDYENFELVISDNASTDGTSVICQQYASKDKRIRYYRNQTNSGGIRNFTRVFDLAHGELFMWASGHDLYDPTFVSQCVNELGQNSSIVLCYPQARRINTQDEPMELILDDVDTRGIASPVSRLRLVLWRLNGAYAVGGIIRTEMLRKAPYRWVAAPDLTVLAELSLLGTFAHIRQPLFYARKLSDAGSLEVFMEKHYRYAGGFWSGQKLFLGMLLEMIKAVMRHVHGFAEKIIGIVSILLYVPLKYRAIPLGFLLLSLKRLRPGD